MTQGLMARRGRPPRKWKQKEEVETEGREGLEEHCPVEGQSQCLCGGNGVPGLAIQTLAGPLLQALQGSG